MGIEYDLSAILAARLDLGGRIGAALRVFRQEDVLQESVAKRTLSRLFKSDNGDGELALLQFVEHLVIALYECLKLLTILQAKYKIVLVLFQNIPECHF